ncbi:MAG: AAA family ATPase [Actinobacteria bacterium]|uniref:DNA 3'-5' helicase n=1 Tax=freshwater metagenome TaxID=449393 RepID=A0A6J6TQK6_9ZZZZ|nr:AAA family ATPase [Actinomycetota bacterium]MSX24973.1 AAA family ATPase [Actinomycetota bacterium]MSY46411.1 AAA family ATPase [Actinomycetota bacterium]MSY57341.1 AAA family ATPase [Actinomycetota bacterium]MTB00902.1 AAA family ATPase [Actinomycetota bacterium]
MSSEIRYSPIAIAEALARVDSKVRTPTPEQIAIIQAPLEPAVVIAGAGSGKTETMSARVLYLVANGILQPNEILGLTFTRKAAGELGVRIRGRLRQLRAAGLLPQNIAIDASVMTYHSYAGRILSEHGIRYGIDASEEPLGDAAIWQMASDLVTHWQDEEFRSTSALSTVIKDVIGLTRLVLEHECSSEKIIAASLPILEKIESLGSKSNAEVRKVQEVLKARISILPMVEKFIEKRNNEGLLSFDDQMSLAAKISIHHLDVAELERSRYKLVLLDEYQDTSQSQVRMLSALFGKAHPVMAVGDPCQAIYTWRGAAAGTIGAFNKNFPKGVGQNGPKQFSLSTTFRNDKIILDLANAVSAPIREIPELDVAQLVARTGAGPGELACGIYESIESEANAIAQYFSALWFSPERAKEDENKRSSFAVLVRTRSLIAEIEIALRRCNIPVEVLGVGGLIHVAEVADVISLLRIVSDPDAGAALMRHLTGARLNIGPADIAALGRYSRSRAESTHMTSKDFIAKIAAGNPLREEADDQILGSLIDALDEIGHAKKDAFTADGYARLTHFAADLRRLRSRAAGPLTDLIGEIENYLSLDVEVMLRDGVQNGRRHLDRFLDEASKFARAGGTIGEFLNWLDVASSEEGGLKSGAPEVRRDVVQILTVHNAKGAEWDVVAIPGLAERVFPSQGHERDDWLTNEKHIPFSLRGDKEELPKIDISQCESNTEVKKKFDDFADECSAMKYLEEVRLGYVAVTRARTHLLCTTSRWRDGTRAVLPSSLYLTVETLAAKSGRVLSEVQPPEDGSRNPATENPHSGTWPRDQLGTRRESFDRAIELVRTSQPDSLEDLDATMWVRDAQALINELHQGKSNPEVFLPPRLSVSTLVALSENPEELALAIRRPMPRPQDEYSRRGTVFHLWVEKHFNQSTLFDEDDLDPVDALEPDQNLEELKRAWLASQWGNRQPHAVEVPFETVIAGLLVRGRIDAVYKDGESFDVIDWKTGSKKLGVSSAIQLAVYRLAWAKLQAISLDKVNAGFHYVPTSITDRPVDLLDEEGLIALISKY